MGGFFGLNNVVAGQKVEGNALGKGGFFGEVAVPPVNSGWTAQTRFVTTPLTGIASNGAGVLIATDQFLHVYRSTNGAVSWTLVATLATGVAGAFGPINFSNGVFIIAGDNLGNIFRSTDQGLTWSALISTGLTTGVNSVAGDGAGHWLATTTVGSPAVTPAASVSNDGGLTWTAHVTAAVHAYDGGSLLWDGAQWVATCLDNGGGSDIVTSPDGFTVTLTQIVPGSESYNNTLAFQGGIYVVPTSNLAVRTSHTTAAALSTNADVPVPLTGAFGLAAVCSGAGRWFAFDFNGGVSDSADAATWHTATEPLNFVVGDSCLQCVYDTAHAVFVAIGGSHGSISTHS